jgi:hypothetical protein
VRAYVGILIAAIALGGAFGTITAGVLVPAASAASPTESFTAVFHDRVCAILPAGPRLCGTGVIDHYGPATTKSVDLRPTPGPEPGCQIFKGTRTATLTKNRPSTLRFAYQGAVCGPLNVRGLSFGTFTIVSGTGTFSNASGSGVLWGTFSGNSILTHYYGVIRLGR